MRYSVVLKPQAEKDLKGMPKKEAGRMYDGLLSLENGLKGDIKKLTDHTPEYRFRIGEWRALFEVEGDRIVIYRIRHRKESYR